MKILVNEEHIDFEAPVWMSDDQKEKFISFMKTMFPEIKVVNALEKKRFGGEKDVEIKAWSTDEYHQLLCSESNDDLASKMGRTEMGVSMKRAEFVPLFYIWAKKKGYTKTTKETTQEFLDEVGI